MNNRELRSFDVFDTVLVRGVVTPKAVFVIVGVVAHARGLTDLTPAAFEGLRVEAEAEAHRLCAAEEVTLDQIYRCFGRFAGVDEDQATNIAAIELDVESRLLRPNPALRGRIAAARTTGARVAFLSDMYLPDTFVAGALAAGGLSEPDDLVVVSSATLVTKASGNAYPQVAALAGVETRRCHHVGDSLRADVRAARGAGWAAEHYGGAAANRYEGKLDAARTVAGPLASLLAGASRLCRLEGPTAPGRARTMHEVASSVAGPVLTAYTLWLMVRARELGLDRLYFVARDGEILLRIARRLRAAGVAPGVELRYLYGSRHAFHLAAMERGDDLSWLRGDLRGATLAEVLARVDLSPGELGIAPDEAARPLVPATDAARVASITASDEFWALVEPRRQRARDGLLAYLDQEGLAGTRAGVVDIGWRGQACRSLAAATSALTPAPTLTYFFYGLMPSDALAPPGSESFSRVGWGTNPRDLPAFCSLLEMFCAGTEGMTVGYEHVGGRSVPMQPPCNERVVAWGIEELHAAIERHAEVSISLLTEFSNLDSSRQLRRLAPALRELIVLLWTAPSREEATHLGAFPLETAQIGGRQAVLIGDTTARTTAATLRRQRAMDRGAWRGGTAALASTPLRVARRGWRSRRVRRVIMGAVRTWRRRPVKSDVEDIPDERPGHVESL